ncbi:MAG: hypothetical protein V3U92_09705 [Cellulophaga sp.]
MTEIKSVKLFTIQENVHESEDSMDVQVQVVVKFHLLDIQMKMHYRMHLFIFNMHGRVEAPVFCPNWDQGTIYLDSKVANKNMLGHFVYPVKALKSSVIIEENMTIELNENFASKSFSPKYTKAFASLIPVTAYASKWSNEYHFDVLFK